MFEHVAGDCTCPGKWCPGCGQVKCQGTFYRNRSRTDGLDNYCQICRSAWHTAYRQENLDRERERERARIRDESRKEYERSWRKDNPDYMRKYNKAYGEANAERIRANRGKYKEQQKAYAQSHLKERAHYEKNRHARKLQAEGTFTRREWEALCKYYDYTCLRCGRQEPDIELTVDHVIPLSIGGSNSIDNIQPLCHSCNARKHAKTIDYREEWESRN